MTLPYDADWICEQYRRAKEPNRMISILAQLNNTQRCNIVKILAERGFAVKPREDKRTAKRLKNIELCRRMAAEGKTVAEAAEACGRSPATIYDIAYREGITFIDKRKLPKKEVKNAGSNYHAG